MGLIWLPTESLQLLGEFLETEKDISALSRTCRRFYSVFIPCLYRYDRGKKNSFALMWAAKKGYEGTVGNSIRYGATPNFADKFGRTPLSYAASEGHEAIVKLLLNMDGVDPDSKDKRGSTPLYWAVSRQQEAIVNLLLNTGRVDPDSRDDYGAKSLSKAISEAHEALVKLLKDRVDLDAKDYTS